MLLFRRIRSFRSSCLTRLVNWNVEVLRKLLKQVVAHREARADNEPRNRKVKYTPNTTGTVFDEVKEIIELPEFDGKAVQRQKKQGLHSP
jgi:hypothetical protein